MSPFVRHSFVSVFVACKFARLSVVLSSFSFLDVTIVCLCVVSSLHFVSLTSLVFSVLYIMYLFTVTLSCPGSISMSIHSIVLNA